MAKRKSKTTQIEVSKAPRRDLDVLLSPPTVTMQGFQQDHAEFRRLHRELFVGGLRESIATLASMQTDVQDANGLMTAAG